MQYAALAALIVLVTFFCLYMSHRDKFKQGQAESEYAILLMQARYDIGRDFRRGLEKGPNITIGTDNTAYGYSSMANVTEGHDSAWFVNTNATNRSAKRSRNR